MKKGYLSQYFKGVAVKQLSAVEADEARSNQHEFNGVSALRTIFGTVRRRFTSQFIYMNDVDDDPLTDDGYLTWYDAREHHLTRTEYRMYFNTTRVSFCASEGDDLIIGLRPDDSVLVIIAENGSTIGNQLKWLFGVCPEDHPGFSIRAELETEQDRIEFVSRFILEQIGIAVETNEETYLEDMLHRFGNEFPSTRKFSEFARSTLTDISPLYNGDQVLMAWMDREEILFRTLEKHLIAERLTSGFKDNVDGFLQFSLSVQNRRKSRVGQALENHLEYLFMCNHIRYSRTKITENHARPDFIFPGISEYHDMTFDASLLTMLGVKSTCKDRWRQVLAEAQRVKDKHLLTLEAAIRENQTSEMQSNRLQLVVPDAVKATYSDKQQQWIMNVKTFMELIRSRQDGFYQGDKKL